MQSDANLPGDDFKHIVVTLDTEAEVEAGEVERLSRQLRAEIKQLDVESVNYPKGDAPAGAKGDPFVWTELLVTLGSAGSVLPILLGTIQGWLDRHKESHRITVTIDGDTVELEGGSSEEHRKLINAYLALRISRG
jgi:hypothetical protein